MTTNVPTPTLGPNGFIAPSEADILAGILGDFNEAFGGNLNTALETPQGQLSTSLAAVLGYANDLFAFYVSQVDPAYSSGRMQDAIGRIYFLERKAAEPTTVQCVCTGAAGVIIPTGALALGADGVIYRCTAGGTISGAGNVTLPFACTVDGPVSCPISNVSTIYQSVPGWDTIDNPAEGIPGTNVESRVEFENRRAASVALNANGMLPAVRASVLNVPDVIDAYVYENSTAASVTTGGVAIAAHSIYVAVAGGDPDDVARAIWLKKAPGCGMVGGTTVTVTDDNSGYNLPYPTYSIKFQIPAALPVLFAIQISNGPTVPADAATQIKAAVLNAFVGGDGGQRPTIGSTIYASRFYAPIVALGPWAQQIISVLIGPTTATLNDFTVDINKIPTVVASDISVSFV